MSFSRFVSRDGLVHGKVWVDYGQREQGTVRIYTTPCGLDVNVGDVKLTDAPFSCLTCLLWHAED